MIQITEIVVVHVHGIDLVNLVFGRKLILEFCPNFWTDFSRIINPFNQMDLNFSCLVWTYFIEIIKGVLHKFQNLFPLSLFCSWWLTLLECKDKNQETLKIINTCFSCHMHTIQSVFVWILDFLWLLLISLLIVLLITFSSQGFIIPHATSCGGYNVFDPSASQSVSPSVLFFLLAQLLWNRSTEFRETL